MDSREHASSTGPERVHLAEHLLSQGENLSKFRRASDCGTIGARTRSDSGVEKRSVRLREYQVSYLEKK